MPVPSYVLLTGATGFLGHYLLRDLLLNGQRVVVLVRSPERLVTILDFWSHHLHFSLPQPIILHGDLNLPNLGLGQADRRWLARQCRAVVHAAASTSFRSSDDGEPWRTNVEGTSNLLELICAAGISAWHQVSTAFVCGHRHGTIFETDLECGQEFHNVYERSKYEAERLVRGERGLNVSVYRPSVIVGDSHTGYTSSYAGLYRFLELGARLAGAGRVLPLRLPLTGEEPCDLVPVDWVAQAIVTLSARRECHGQTFHLTARPPASAGFIQETAADELGLQGMQLIGTQELAAPSRLEELFFEGLADYWHYLGGTPAFDAGNTIAALSHLPPPPIDALRLRRFIRFAKEQRWGRPLPRSVATESDASPCARYIEKTFPRLAQRSNLARAVGLNIVVGFDIQGRGGGQWSCRWERGELKSVRRGLEAAAQVVYHTDPATFAEVVECRVGPPQAFFAERITITGDLELALKLATLFGEFLRETTPPRVQHPEAMDATHS
jgi:thioester reductase-like protein